MAYKPLTEDNVKDFPNFTYREFACKCGGKYCDGFPVAFSYDLAKNLQTIRDHFGKPLIITSPIRCEKWNSEVGGVSNSKHKVGWACDFYINGVSYNTLANYVKTLPYFHYCYRRNKSNGKSIDEGYVKFKINGKTFKVNVNNGVAKKKITLSKAKTYYYTAKYVSKYYKSEPSTSKVAVNNVIVKKGKYVFALTASQYKKIKYIKNHRHPDHPLDLYFKTKTNQYYNNQLPIYVFFYSYYGRLYGELTNLVRYQYIAMPNNNPQDWIYISGKMVF